MKNKIFNSTHISGYLYDHKLEARTTGAQSKNPGTNYIGGSIDIATDDAMTNIVTVHFTYEVPVRASGKSNPNFKILTDIITGVYKTVMKDGKDNATKITVDSAIGLNEWFSDRNGQPELVSTRRNEGGFVRIASDIEEDEKLRATFDADILLYNVRRLEPDEENNLPERAILSCYVMDFRKNFLPTEFMVYAPAAMDYYEGLEASKKNPIFTRIKGIQKSQIVTRTYTEESAFGEPSVREFKNTRKEYIVTWGAKEPYEIGDDCDISAADITKGLADRETTVAAIKKRYDDNNSGGTSAFSTGDTQEDFNF
jgi:hypothetical protein